MTIGTHILAEFYDCKTQLLNSTKRIEEIMDVIIAKAKLNKIHAHYHKFQPQGVTGFVLLAESHISLHTWPEHGYMALDIFTCGNEGNAKKAFEIMLKEFKPKHYNHVEQKRG